MTGCNSDETKLNCKNNLSYYFTEYCDNSTIHGLKFLGERKRTVAEKIWWLIFVTLSLYLCTSLIIDTYKKWVNSPVIVSFATSETPIGEIPFPAITICPLVKTDLDKFNFKSIPTDNYTIEEAANLTYLSLICPKVLELFPELNTTEILDDHAINFLIDVVPDFEASIQSCTWCKGNCHDKSKNIFTPVLTSGAICYTYNMLDWGDMFTDISDLEYYNDLGIGHQTRSLWNTEDGYHDENELETYPRRTSMTGTNGGFEVVLESIVKDDSYNCGDSLTGYKIMIHHPGEMARFHQHYFWLPIDQLISVNIKPNMITTYTDLKTYNPQDRQCYFQGEMVLRYFKVYNQQNCMLECLTNFTLEKCGCVSFHMPRSDDVSICGPGRLECAEQADRDFLKIKTTSQKSIRNVGKDKVFLDNYECNCIPACYSLRYDAETSQLNWDWQNLDILNTSHYDENVTIHLSRLRIFFKDMQFMTSERNELYGQTEFWANCGGLVGLFTGFSFISFIEILYFCTLRLFCNIRKYGWRHWSGAEELKTN